MENINNCQLNSIKKHLPYLFVTWDNFEKSTEK